MILLSHEFKFKLNLEALFAKKIILNLNLNLVKWIEFISNSLNSFSAAGAIFLHSVCSAGQPESGPPAGRKSEPSAGFFYDFATLSEEKSWAAPCSNKKLQGANAPKKCFYLSNRPHFNYALSPQHSEDSCAACMFVDREFYEGNFLLWSCFRFLFKPTWIYKFKFIEFEFIINSNSFWI